MYIYRHIFIYTNVCACTYMNLYIFVQSYRCIHHCTKFGIYLTLHFSVKPSNDSFSAHLHDIYCNFAWKCKGLKGVTLVTFNQLIKDVMALMV